MVAWWLVFGPVALGGPATFTIVTGHSMEPTFMDGDLVIARERPSYGVGDVIVFPVERGRVIIHRLIAGNAEDGWITQGDNNDRRDSWTVPDSVILGEKWLYFPRAGLPFRWTQQNPMLFGAGVALFVAVSAIGVRRRLRVHPFLVDAMASGTRVSSLAERPPIEIVLLCLAGFVTAVASIGLGLLATVGRVLSFGSLVLVVPGALALVVVVFQVRRLGDGVGVEEPRSSLYALSSRCWRVDHLPQVLDYVDHDSALGLRAVLDRFRLPVLLHVDSAGVHTYLTITRRAIAHRWRVANEPARGDEEPKWPPPSVTVAWPPPATGSLPASTGNGSVVWAPPELTGTPR